MATRSAKEPAHLLLIDDEAVTRTLLARRLRARGYEVAEAASGGDGLAHLARRPSDLVICDLMLPDLDGQQVLARLRATAGTADLPVIMLTASASLDDKVEALGGGADDYLVKPVALDELTLRIERLLHERARRRMAEAAAHMATLRAALLGHAVRLMAETSPEAVLRRTVEVALQTIPAGGGVMVLPEGDAGWVVQEIYRDGAWQALGRRGGAESAIGIALRRGRAHLATDLAASGAADDRALAAALAARALLVVPLVGESGPLAAVALIDQHDGSQMPAPFTDDDVEALIGLCEQATLALENAALQTALRASRDEARRRQEVAEQVAALARELARCDGLASVLTLTLAWTRTLLGARRAAVLLLDETGTRLERVAADGLSGLPDHLPLGEVAASSEVLAAGRPVAVTRADASAHCRAIMEQSGLERLVLAPLLAQQHTIGLLMTDQPAAAGDPAASDNWRPLAEQCGLAIERARLLEQAARALRAEREARAQLTQAGKLAAVGQLAAGVAHEINQPLMVIRAQAQMLARRVTDEPIRQKLVKIEAMTDRIDAIVTHLRAFGRRSGGAAHPVDLNTIVHEALLLIGQQLRSAGVQVTLLLREPPPVAWADGQEVEQVLLNLLTNARDVLEDRGGEVTISTAAGEGWAELTVADTGVGIAPATLERIFEPFFTTKVVGKGTGLGLSISREIAERWGGSLTADSAVGRGTRLTLRLPRPAPVAAGAAIERPAAAG